MFNKTSLKHYRFFFKRPNIIIFNEKTFFMLPTPVMASSTTSGLREKSLAKPLLAKVSRILQVFSKNFYEVLVVKGIGYRAFREKSALVLNLGYSHAISLDIPNQLIVLCPGKATIFISGRNLEEIKNFCSIIMNLRKTDSYKGKGIFYRTQKFKAKNFKK